MEKPGERFSVLLEKLRKRGFRITPQRAAILREITLNQDHPSVEQVHDRVKAAFPMTSLATVYKTINLLKEMQEVLELGFAGEGSRYDAANPRPHPHLICIRCRRIIDPEIAGFENLQQELAHKYGYRILNHRVDFFGICPQCQTAGEAGVSLEGR